MVLNMVIGTYIYKLNFEIIIKIKCIVTRGYTYIYKLNFEVHTRGTHIYKLNFDNSIARQIMNKQNLPTGIQTSTNVRKFIHSHLLYV